MKDLVTTVHNLPLARNKDVFAFGKKNPFRFAGPAGKTEKLQVNRGRWWRTWRRRRWRLWSRRRDDGRGNLHVRLEDIASGALVFCVFSTLKPVEAQPGIERTRLGRRFLARTTLRACCGMYAFLGGLIGGPCPGCAYTRRAST